MTKSCLAAVLATAVSLAGARISSAQEAHTDAQTVAYDEPEAEAQLHVEAQAGQAGQAEIDEQEAAAYAQAQIPPGVEQPPAAAAGGTSYCFAGGHPVDTRTVAGPAWDETQGTHLHPYPPFDLRLFTLRNGCYYFVGDPTDFGYRGSTYSYYGAHPVHDHHGGGWCFMIGGHAHGWRPWSPYFTVSGPWFYWYGPYDHFFWNHWPYYAHYYRSYYPRYYSGGRFYRGHRHQRAVAPPIGRMAARPARAMPSGGGFSNPPMGGSAPAPARGSWNRTPGWSASTRSVAPAAPGWSSPAPARVGGDVPSVTWSTRPGATRSVTPQPAVPANRSGFSAAPERTYRAQPQPSYQGSAPAWSGGYRAAPAPSYSAPSFRSAPAPSRSFSAPSFRSAPAPASPSRSSGGGGWNSGGGGGGGARSWRR
jgi:hypothetical protein